MLAVVASGIAIWLAIKAGSNLKLDRRHVFELGVIEQASVLFEANSDNLIGMRGIVRLLPARDFAALREWVFDRKVFPDGETVEDLQQAWGRPKRLPHDDV